MQSRSKQSSQKIRVPRGVSVVEFVGCLAALGGGIVLGSIYLGVDVQTLAAGILEKADIDVPAILSTDNAASEESPVDETLTENALETVVVDETVAGHDIEQPVARLDAETVTIGEAASVVADLKKLKELTDAEKLAATEACWLALNESVQEETANRSKSISEPGGWQLFDYLLHRQKGHQKVVDAIEQLDHHGVDPRLHAHVEQILTWHRAGAELFDRAAQLLTDAPAGKLTGPFAQSWQSAATQHRMEEKLILNKHAAVANYLEHAKKISSAASASELR